MDSQNTIKLYFWCSGLSLMEQSLHQLSQSCLAADKYILYIFFLLCCNSLGNRKPGAHPGWTLGCKTFCSQWAHWLGSVSVCPNLGILLPTKVRQNQSSDHRWSFPSPFCPAAWDRFDLSLLEWREVIAEHGERIWDKPECAEFKKNKEVGESSKYGSYASPSYSSFLLHSCYTMVRAVAGSTVERWGI